MTGTRLRYCCSGCVTAAELQLLAPPPPSSNDATLVQDTFRVEGMHCPSCVRAIELGLSRVPGVRSVSADYVMGLVELSWAGEAAVPGTVPAPIGREARRLGYRLRAQGAAADRIEKRAELKRLMLSWLCMMQVMMLSVPSYMAGPGDIEPDILQLFRVAEALLALPVLGYCAVPFFRYAWRDLRLRRLGMDLPICTGLLVAAGASLYAVASSSGAVYFDSVTMFVALLLTSRWLQERALNRARTYLDTLTAGQSPTAARVLRTAAGRSVEIVSAEALSPDDLVLVRPGETVPADGIVAEGESLCSEALLTGESEPIPRIPGQPILAGTVNLQSMLLITVQRVGSATLLASLARLAAQAARSRPDLVSFADQAARWFMAGVAAVALAAGAYWLGHDPSRAVSAVVAILIVTCPCALALAAPLTLAVAQARLARAGVLVTRLSAIETLARARTFLFDKTGTLTTGQLQLARTVVLEPELMDSDRALALAAALEESSNHPVALSLRASAKESGLPPLLAEHCINQSDGVCGRIGSLQYRIGKADADTLARAGARPDESAAVLSCGDLPCAVFFLSDSVRAGAAAFIEEIGGGAHAAILSGDRPELVARMARRLGLPRWRGGLSPADKQRAIRTEQEAGAVVAMVGDGLNDAAALASADVALAFGSGATLSQTRADFIVVAPDFAALGAARRLARRCQAIIRENLAWGLCYNLIAIPAAAAGDLPPAVAAFGMAASSLLVVGNSLRLFGGRASRPGI